MTEPDITADDERPFLLSDGECMVFDAGYLDTDSEIEGVLAVSYSVGGGLWALIGKHVGNKYVQVWEEAGKPKAAGLRPIN